MALSKRDMGFAGIVALVLVVLFASSVRDKPKPLPADETHKAFSAAVAGGEARETVELKCTACHGTPERPLSKGHPPKEQCLICHISVQAH